MHLNALKKERNCSIVKSSDRVLANYPCYLGIIPIQYFQKVFFMLMISFYYLTSPFKNIYLIYSVCFVQFKYISPYQFLLLCQLCVISSSHPNSVDN